MIIESVLMLVILSGGLFVGSEFGKQEAKKACEKPAVVQTKE